MAEAEAAEDARRTEHIPEWKREEVDALVETLKSYESVGIVNVAGIPSRQLQAMRRELHGDAELRISRNTLVERALENVDDGLEELVEFVSGQVGLIGTDKNPFGLYRQLEASKTPAPINAGEVAPNDIVIPEGDTGIDPGPFVGDLQQVGANARIESGSIKVLEDSMVLEAGEEVDQTLANVLSELGIEPKEVGLDLRAVYSDGVLFRSEELELDIDRYRADVQSAAAAGQNLSVNAVYPTDRTAVALLAKAGGEARSLGLNTAIAEPDLVDDLLGRADSQVRALAARIGADEALPEELQGMEGEAPIREEPAAKEETEEDQPDEQEETEGPDDDEDEDNEDGGDALGEMFG